MTRQNISCIILAGGQGKRMGGADKGLLQYRGKSLVEHVIQIINPQVDEIVISANRNLDDYMVLGYPVITDGNKNFHGPLAGIASAVPHCKHDWVLVIPCDMPSLPDTLVSTLKQYTVHSRLVAISINDRLQLVFLLHRNLLESINRFLSGNQHTVMQWLDSIDHYTLAMDNENCFYNINKMEQLENLQ